MQRRQIQQWAVHLRYFLVVGLGLAMTACFNEPNFSDTPEIEFREVSAPFFIPGVSGIGQQARDSVIITVDFKDGDGDLGDDIPIPVGDSLKYAQGDDWGAEYNGNYKIQAFILYRNNWREVIQTENQTLFFPRLAREGQKGPIEGTIEFEQVYFYSQGAVRYPTKYEITIRDRQLNMSNTVETDTVVVPWRADVVRDLR